VGIMAIHTFPGRIEFLSRLGFGARPDHSGVTDMCREFIVLLSRIDTGPAPLGMTLITEGVVILRPEGGCLLRILGPEGVALVAPPRGSAGSRNAPFRGSRCTETALPAAKTGDAAPQRAARQWRAVIPHIRKTVLRPKGPVRFM